MDDSTDENTKEALLSVTEECLSHPEKQQEFVDEGCIDLLLELCRSNKNLEVQAYAAGTLAVLCHQNHSAKAKTFAQGGAASLVSLCRAVERERSNLGDPSNINRLQVHEQSAAVLQKLAYENAACQSGLVSAGATRQLVRLCDVFNPAGSHANCCQVLHDYSKKANRLLGELTKGQKLIGAVKELGEKETGRIAMHLLQTGIDINILSELFNKIHKVELFDTTLPGKDIVIANELIERGLAWPDLSQQEDSEDARTDVKSKDKSNSWNDIKITEVIDAGHFWAHIGGQETTENRVEEIRKFLHSQTLEPLTSTPQQGEVICVSTSLSGHKDYYRACILDYTSTAQGSRAKVFAIDNGFTAIVPGSSLAALPTELLQHRPQISLCCLAGVQPPPKHATVLEYAAGALRNLCHNNINHVAFIATAGGIEALLKLCTIPDKRILVQVLGALLNLTMDFKYRARIGYLGGIKTLLEICQKYADDNEILELAVGALQTMMVDTIINRSRIAEADGLAVFVHLYYYTTSESVRTSILGALRNLIGGGSGGSSSSNDGKPRPVLDIRNIMDDTVNQANFSLSVSAAEDGYRPMPRHQRRRKNRRTAQMADPKPTHVSLSLENLRKGYTDDTCSDSDDDYGGRWTSETEGDTDGESLLKDGTAVSCNQLQLSELKSEKYYVQMHHVSFIEDDTHEFRSQTNIHDVSKRPIAKALCAFLNNKTCGTVYIGVNKDGVVAGVRILRKQRDMLRLGIDELMDRFKPAIKHDMYKIEFVPIVRPAGSESAITRQYVDDRFIIEVSIVKCTGLVYTTPNGKSYFRNKSANIEMSTQEIREKTVHEQETIYNNEIKQLRKQLKDMRKQLDSNKVEKPRPESLDQSPNHTTHALSITTNDLSQNDTRQTTRDAANTDACVIS